METTDKELLLKDLSARLPYKVKCFCKWTKEAPNGTVGCIQEISTFLLDELEIMDKPEYSCQVSEIKPYLRPMSSMTEEEVEKYNELCGCNAPFPGIVEESVAKFLDWLNEHHFDYRNLIEKDLALEAPEDMYKLK